MQDMCPICGLARGRPADGRIDTDIPLRFFEDLSCKVLEAWYGQRQRQFVTHPYCVAQPCPIALDSLSTELYFFPLRYERS